MRPTGRRAIALAWKLQDARAADPGRPVGPARVVVGVPLDPVGVSRNQIGRAQGLELVDGQPAGGRIVREIRRIAEAGAQTHLVEGLSTVAEVLVAGDVAPTILFENEIAEGVVGVGPVIAAARTFTRDLDDTVRAGDPALVVVGRGTGRRVGSNNLLVANRRTRSGGPPLDGGDGVTGRDRARGQAVGVAVGVDEVAGAVADLCELVFAGISVGPPGGARRVDRVERGVTAVLESHRPRRSRDAGDETADHVKGGDRTSPRVRDLGRRSGRTVIPDRVVPSGGDLFEFHQLPVRAPECAAVGIAGELKDVIGAVPNETTPRAALGPALEEGRSPTSIPCRKSRLWTLPP